MGPERTTFGAPGDQYYESLAGWQVKPDDSGVNSRTRTVVVIVKSPGYASIVINTGTGGKGSRFQINAYPTGKP